MDELIEMFGFMEIGQNYAALAKEFDKLGLCEKSEMEKMVAAFSTEEAEEVKEMFKISLMEVPDSKLKHLRNFMSWQCWHVWRTLSNSDQREGLKIIEAHIYERPDKTRGFKWEKLPSDKLREMKEFVQSR